MTHRITHRSLLLPLLFAFPAAALCQGSQAPATQAQIAALQQAVQNARWPATMPGCWSPPPWFCS